MLKRLFDILSSLAVLIFILPLFVLVSLLIMLDSKGGVFYKQIRVGQNAKKFELLKFRTMRPNSDQIQITVGNRDPRVTRIGYYLRKYKLDEIPQLINIIKGEMSVVGPRPEVPKYVENYTDKQKKVLTVKPGLTDFASLQFVDESELLAQSENPERTYVEEILPQKLDLALEYIEKRSFALDLKLIFKTLHKILR